MKKIFAKFGKRVKFEYYYIRFKLARNERKKALFRLDAKEALKSLG